MTRPSITDVRGIQNFATVYQWNVMFSTLPKKVSTTALTSNNGEPLNFRCESTELPKLTNESMIVSIRGHKIKQSGIHTYSNILTLIFVETVDNMISQFLHDWREACWEAKTGVQQTKQDIQAVMELHRLNSVDKEIWKYKMTGVYLEDFDLGQLDGVTSEAFKPSIVLSYDYFEDGENPGS